MPNNEQMNSPSGPEFDEPRAGGGRAAEAAGSDWEPDAGAATSTRGPRNPGMKWPTVWLGGFFVVVFLLRLAWGWEAERRLNARIAELRATGQPVLLEDFATEPVPDEDNAAYYIKQAAAKIVEPNDPKVTPSMLQRRADGSSEWLADAQQCVESNREALALLRTARSKHETDWQIRLRTPVINVLLPNLAEVRAAARLVVLAAVHAHYAGDDAACVAYLRDALALGRALDTDQQLLITHLVRLAVDGLTASSLAEVVAELEIAPVEQGHGNSGHAPRGEIHVLIAHLLEREEYDGALIAALCVERLALIDMADGFAANVGRPAAPMVAGAFQPLVAPLLKLDVVRGLGYYDKLLVAARAEAWPAARPLLPAVPAYDSIFAAIARLATSVALPSQQMPIQLHYRGLTERFLAATALAVRLYEIDHGTRPPTLDVLVPKYLPRIPIDPLAPDGRPLGYLPNADVPRLYSVGEDGVDDGGAYKLRKDGTPRRNSPDMPFFLDGPPGRA